MTEAPREQKRPLRPPIREVTPTGILRWLRLGFRDLFKAGWPSLAHGLIVTAISLVIIGITFLFWPLLPGAVSGFLVVGPVLAAGLYALSYRIEQGEAARFRDAVNAWRCGSRCLFRFGLLLVGIGTVWVLLSVVMFYFFVHAEIAGPTVAQGRIFMPLSVGALLDHLDLVGIERPPDRSRFTDQQRLDPPLVCGNHRVDDAFRRQLATQGLVPAMLELTHLLRP